ncbi:hypothetical protein K438DRAFT_1755206 [Mycena galopus ATCC 62051]|nr:hypothetical protein K438DRAFT_1755206 [Mycena galopus ATCC 62051]
MANNLPLALLLLLVLALLIWIRQFTTYLVVCPTNLVVNRRISVISMAMSPCPGAPTRMERKYSTLHFVLNVKLVWIPSAGACIASLSTAFNNVPAGTGHVLDFEPRDEAKPSDPLQTRRELVTQKPTEKSREEDETNRVPHGVRMVPMWPSLICRDGQCVGVSIAIPTTRSFWAPISGESFLIPAVAPNPRPRPSRQSGNNSKALFLFLRIQYLFSTRRPNASRAGFTSAVPHIRDGLRGNFGLSSQQSIRFWATYFAMKTAQALLGQHWRGHTQTYDFNYTPRAVEHLSLTWQGFSPKVLSSII